MKSTSYNEHTDNCTMEYSLVPRKKSSIESGDENFGRRLARLRQEAGFTQQELAEAIGISRRKLAYYEGETEHPPTTILPLLAEALKVPSDEILGIKLESSSLKIPDSRLWRRFKKLEELPLRERREAIKLLDLFLEREELKKQVTHQS